MGGGHSFKYSLISLMTRVCDHYSSPLMPRLSPALVAQGFAFSPVSPHSGRGTNAFSLPLHMKCDIGTLMYVEKGRRAGM